MSRFMSDSSLPRPSQNSESQQHWFSSLMAGPRNESTNAKEHSRDSSPAPTPPNTNNVRKE